MPTLREFQQQFLASFQSKTVAPMRPFVSDQSTLARLQIYHNSITGGLIQALGETFEVCKQLVGDEFFNAMAQHYIDQTVSSSPDIGEYGASFPDFVAEFEPAQAVPYLADMARIGWYFHHAMRQSSNDCFDGHAFARLTNTEQAQTRLQLNTSASWMTSHYPLLAIWRLCTDQSSDTLTLNDDTLHHFLVWRRDNRVQLDEITADDLALLALLDNQPTIHELEIMACAQQLDIEQLLPNFITYGWITGWSRDGS